MSAFIRYTPIVLGGGAGSSGLTSINTDTTPAQTLTIGTTGTDFAIVDNGTGDHKFNLPTASASNRGALSSADWMTFNNKQNALTFGDLTSTPTTNLVVTGGTGAVIGSGVTLTLTGANLVEATSSVLTITGATNAVLGTGVSIQVKQSGTSQAGYLSSTDWNTFNNKQPAGSYLTAVSVATANGLAGSSSGGTTPSLTLSTTINAPILSGNGTAIAAAATTGSGSTAVLSSTPTLTNPIVGTQSQGDSSTKAASTAYVDTAVANAVAGINPAVAVQAATTAASDTSGFTYNNGASGIGATLTGSVNTALTVDGYTFTALGQRLLVKNDTQSPSGAFNGVYYVTQVQTAILPLILTRALDYDMPSDMNNTGAIPVINGTVNGTTSWVLTSLVVTVGTTPLTFAQFTRNPADYLLKANNLSDVASKASSFDNLSPMTTGGDIIYGGASGTGTRLANGSSGQFLKSNGTTLAPSWAAPTIALTAPTVTRFTSTGSTTGYLFTVSSANATVGATYTNNSNTYTVLATIAAGTQLFCSQASAPLASGTLTKSGGTGDATITFSANVPLATYTLPTSPSPLSIQIEGIAGGGGGSGSGTAGFPSTAGAGGITAFGPGLLVGNGGVGAVTTSGTGTGGTGGTATSLSGPIILDLLQGAPGQGGFNATGSGNYLGGNGGSSYYGGAGSGQPAGAGTAAITNTGSGGGGGGTSGQANATQGAGGGVGGFFKAIINAPAATYVYCVGAAGTNGAAATNGNAGAAGGSGSLKIIELYQ